MKIGIFGGTFNPVHNGHLIICEYAADTCGLDKVLFVPAKTPVHKRADLQVSPEDRCAMVALALRDNPLFELSRIEIDRPEDSYTIYTLDSLAEKYYADDLYLIIGSDSFNELDTWKDYKKIIDSVNIIVFRRPGDEKLRDDIPAVPGRFFTSDNPLIGISSTGIRASVAAGRSVRYLLPDEVYKYITDKGLYLN